MKNGEVLDIETKLDITIRYMNLLSAKWMIEDEINREFPVEFSEHRKRMTQIMLRRGIIKCRHEK